MAATAFVVTISRMSSSFAPAPNMVGYFTGCPDPAIPSLRVPEPVLRTISARCCVTPAFIPITKWFTVPAVQYALSPTAVRR